MPSFDIVSKVDMQEVDNAVNQAQKELSQRYDFKGSKSEIIWNKGEEMTVVGDSSSKLETVLDILKTKLAKRKVPLKNIDYGAVEDASGGLVRQELKIRQGIPQDKAKEIAKLVKDMKLKVQAQVQGDQLRVSGKKIDDLQEVMQSLKSKDMGISLQFINMRS